MLSIRPFWVVILLLLSVAPSFAQTGSPAQQAGPKGEKLESIEAILSDFIDNVAALKFGEAILSMKTLGNPYDSDQFRKTVLGLTIIGKPFYYEKIVDRRYGSSGKDIIYKIVTENNVYFFRFVLHKRIEENWIITWLAIQSELEAPLPKIWSHINP